jgi:hypothetical protein
MAGENKLVHFENTAWENACNGCPPYFAKVLGYKHRMFMKLTQKYKILFLSDE